MSVPKIVSNRIIYSESNARSIEKVFLHINFPRVIKVTLKNSEHFTSPNIFLSKENGLFLSLLFIFLSLKYIVSLFFHNCLTVQKNCNIK